MVSPSDENPRAWRWYCLRFQASTSKRLTLQLAVFTRLKPVMDAVASNVYHISGTSGAGSTVKIIHQLLAGVHITAPAEVMVLAARAGIHLNVMYDVVTHPAGNSWMFGNHMQHAVDGNYTPRSAVDIFVEALWLVADTAKALCFPLPLSLFSTALNMFASASNAGYGKEDDSAVIKIFRRLLCLVSRLRSRHVKNWCDPMI